MTEDYARIDESEDLRRRAEQALAGRSTSAAELAAEDDRQLLHELQVHQIELAMQNEELRRLKAAPERPSAGNCAG